MPEDLRGRFFGRLRFTWQAVGIIFATVITLFLVPALYLLQLDFFAAAGRLRDLLLNRPPREATDAS